MRCLFYTRKCHRIDVIAACAHYGCSKRVCKTCLHDPKRRQQLRELGWNACTGCSRTCCELHLYHVGTDSYAGCMHCHDVSMQPEILRYHRPEVREVAKTLMLLRNRPGTGWALLQKPVVYYIFDLYMRARRQHSLDKQLAKYRRYNEEEAEIEEEEWSSTSSSWDWKKNEWQ